MSAAVQINFYGSADEEPVKVAIERKEWGGQRWISMEAGRVSLCFFDRDGAPFIEAMREFLGAEKGGRDE